MITLTWLALKPLWTNPSKQVHLVQKETRKREFMIFVACVNFRDFKSLVHISQKKIEMLVSKRTLNFHDFKDFDSCVKCDKGRHINMRRIGSNGASKVFELVVSISLTFLPFLTKSWNGWQYLVILVHDYSPCG